MKEADRSFIILAYFQCQVQPRLACSDYSLLYGVLGQKKRFMMNFRERPFRLRRFEQRGEM